MQRSVLRGTGSLSAVHGKHDSNRYHSQKTGAGQPSCFSRQAPVLLEY
jgi:hypothetical protein